VPDYRLTIKPSAAKEFDKLPAGVAARIDEERRNVRRLGLRVHS
jgi:hypothetical protein